MSALFFPSLRTLFNAFRRLNHDIGRNKVSDTKKKSKGLRVIEEI